MKSISRSIDELVSGETTTDDETVYIQMTWKEWNDKYKPSDYA